jgi:hypothetical protein
VCRRGEAGVRCRYIWRWASASASASGVAGRVWFHEPGRPSLGRVVERKGESEGEVQRYRGRCAEPMGANSRQKLSTPAESSRRGVTIVAGRQVTHSPARTPVFRIPVLHWLAPHWLSAVCYPPPSCGKPSPP